MDVLVIVRDWLNKYLETPADQFLAGILATIVLGLIGAFIPSVRKTTVRCFTASLDWLKERAQGLFNRAPEARTLRRFGVKIGLDKEIDYYLGKMDPNRVGPDTIDTLIQGPFCAKCSYLLTEWRNGESLICSHCPQCSSKLVAPVGGAALHTFKTVMYRALDAEKRQTGRLKESDGK